MEKSSQNFKQTKPEFIQQVNLLQIIGYFFSIIIVWVIPLSVAVILGIIYFQLVIQPDLDIYTSATLFLNLFFDGNVKYFLTSFLTPLFVIGLYLFELFLVALVTKILIGYCNLRSPSKEMIGAKGIAGKERKEVDYYHLRGAIFRIMKWIFVRCPFPWMIKWAFSFAGNNKYGKGTVLEDQYYCQEFFETGKNVYIDKLAIVSSHLVEGAYGAITLKKVMIEDNAVIGANVGISPGAFVEKNAEVINNSMAPKFKKFKTNEKYHGIPVSKISKDEYKKILNLPSTESKSE